MSYERLAQYRPISGHVFRVSRKSGPVWYAKYRLPDGRQVQKKIAPAWTRPGRPADGFANRRGAEAWLADVLAQAHGGTLPGMVRTGVTFARAAEEWLRYCVEDRACKPSTMVDYRHTVERVPVPVFGPLLLEEITPAAIAAWRGSLNTRRGRATSSSRSSMASSAGRRSGSGYSATRCSRSSA